MGYESKIVVKVEGKAKKIFEKRWEECKALHPNVNPCPDYIFSDDREGTYLIWDWQKWYREWPEVSVNEDVMEELMKLGKDMDAEGFGFSCRRIGEDFEDNEEKSNVRGDAAFTYPPRIERNFDKLTMHHWKRLMETQKIRENALILALYELYKSDWLTRITHQQKADSIADWYECAATHDGQSYESFLRESGYDGSLYVSRVEFENNELLDKSYIEELCKDYPTLLSDYKKMMEGK